MFNIAICDDDGEVCRYLERVIDNFCKAEVWVAEIEPFYSGELLIEALNSGQQFHLIFLDLCLETTSGIEVGRRIRQKIKDDLTQIVFISAKSQYAMKLFKFRPLDFLIKPLEEEHVCRVTKEAFRILGLQGYVFGYGSDNSKGRILLKDVLYFESKGRQVCIHTVSGTVLYYGSLKDVVAELDLYPFLRIHQSYFVNYLHVSWVEGNFLQMSNQERLTISQTYKKEAQMRIADLTRKGV